MTVRLRERRGGRSDGRWTADIRVRLPSGVPHRERVLVPVEAKSAALGWARERERHLLIHGPETPAAKSPTLAEFEERFLAHADTNNKPSTACAKRVHLKVHLLPAFGAMALGAIGAAEVEAYKAAKVKAGQSAKSVNNHLGTLRKLLNLAHEWGLRGPVPRLKALALPPQEFAFLDFPEADRFLEAVETEPFWRTMLIVALRTGLRYGELLALRWEDVDLSACRVVVRRSMWRGKEGTPKGGRTREVPLCDSARAALKAHQHLRGPLVFCHEDGVRLTHAEGKRIVPRVCVRAGLPKRLTWHDLRHSFASHLVMHGAPLKAVQELMGHATIEQTMRYAHLAPAVAREAVMMLDGKSTTKKEEETR